MAKKWAAAPEHGDEIIRGKTGRGWEEWRALIDAWPGRTGGHTAIAAWLVEEHGVGGWWAQAVTVGYERIAGLRVPYQLSDGKFGFGVSRTLEIDPEELRARLLDEKGRAALFPKEKTELRSKPTSKNVRIAIGDGSAEISFASKAGGRVTVTVQYTKLDSPEAVEKWKPWWVRWLEAL